MVLTRKLVKAGPSSHTVALPKEWVEKNKLQKGDVVYVSFVSDNELRISTQVAGKGSVAEEVVIDVTNKSRDSLQRLITSAYLNNCGTMLLSGDEVEKRLPDIREIVQDFVALEITDQGPRKVVIKDLLNPSEVSVEKTLRRMDMIVRSMFDDVLSKPKQGLHFQDRDVNRLYFLMLRALKNALRSEEVAKQLKLTPTEVLAVWQTTMHIENLADSLTRIAPLMLNLKGKEKEVDAVVRSLGGLFADVMASYYQSEVEKADLLAKKRLELEARIAELNGVSREFGEVAQEARSMITSVCNIARVVIDKK